MFKLLSLMKYFEVAAAFAEAVFRILDFSL